MFEKEPFWLYISFFLLTIAPKNGGHFGHIEIWISFVALCEYHCWGPRCRKKFYCRSELCDSIEKELLVQEFWFPQHTVG